MNKFLKNYIEYREREISLYSDEVIKSYEAPYINEELLEKYISNDPKKLKNLELTDSFKIKIIKKNPNFFKFLNKTSENVEIIAIQNDIKNIAFLKNPTNTIKNYIENLTKKPFNDIFDLYQKYIIQQSIYKLSSKNLIPLLSSISDDNLMYIYNRKPHFLDNLSLPESFQLKLININPLNIRHIEQPTVDVQIKSVKSSEKALNLIDLPDMSVIDLHNRLYGENQFSNYDL